LVIWKSTHGNPDDRFDIGVENCKVEKDEVKKISKGKANKTCPIMKKRNLIRKCTSEKNETNGTNKEVEKEKHMHKKVEKKR